MLMRVMADLVVVIHLGFISFVLLGGLLALKWRWAMWLHLPAACWGTGIEFMGWECPLTPLENSLREASGAAGYPGGFVEHYLIPLIYPQGLTPHIQILLGIGVVGVNLVVYFLVWRGVVLSKNA